MNYILFCKILNKHIFQGQKRELIKRIASHPERFLGLFRPSNPNSKILQNLLQSHEIRMGNALEEIIENFFLDLGFKILSKSIVDENGKILFLDQYFTNGRIYYFIEQKIRDDHDSSKKVGQISNFEKKIEILYLKHEKNLVGIFYFIDPILSKNKNFYLKEIERIKNNYDINLYLFYGKELFQFFGHDEIWNNIIDWLVKWKNNLPDLPEINFDISYEESFNELKDLEINVWEKILNNKELWTEGVIKTISQKGTILEHLLNYFENQEIKEYKELASLLKINLENYYNRKF